ncbi:MAG: hypothetical protein IT544_01385 [Rhodobacteraceae bacterium]|nr:hypothetical protein [Paracoccaceae bacterium]
MEIAAFPFQTETPTLLFYNAAGADEAGVLPLSGEKWSADDHETGASLIVFDSGDPKDVEVNSVDSTKVFVRVGKPTALISMDIERAECDVSERAFWAQKCFDLDWMLVKTHERIVSAKSGLIDLPSRDAAASPLHYLNFYWL